DRRRDRRGGLPRRQLGLLASLGFRRRAQREGARRRRGFGLVTGTRAALGGGGRGHLGVRRSQRAALVRATTLLGDGPGWIVLLAVRASDRALSDSRP